MDSTIAFAYQPSISLLTIDTMEFDWITDTKETTKIFEQLSKVNDFEYYYINQILIIPDPIPSPRLNWSKKVIINNLEIDCNGRFLAFFHYNNNGNTIFANSLTFPEYIFLKDNIDII
ncbi:hypothetical protein [Clostridium sp. YIM B02506]|uniref:hypothetical protein n=1 Tax=Clostridium sp. YIM B02506 TaxID=2910680 RepID=UPI001EED557A|nr:hypothetical protein [Clostridium sp. YIM B02506]